MAQSWSTKFDIIEFATQNYIQKDKSTFKEFKSDYSRLRSINNLLKRFDGNETHSRLILNHIVILCNVFRHESISPLLFYTISEEYWSDLKTFLLFLNLLPVVVIELGINTLEIPTNQDILKVLKSL